MQTQTKRYLAILLIAIMLYNIIPVLPTVDAAGASHSRYSACDQRDQLSTPSIDALKKDFEAIQSEFPVGK